MSKLSKLFVLTLANLLFVCVFSVGSSQHSTPSDSGLSHSQHSEDNQQSSENTNNHQHKGMSQMLVEDADIDIRFTLTSSFFERKRVFLGVSSNIQGQINPVLEVPQDAIVEITLLNDTVLQHNFVIPDLSLHSEHVDSSDMITFTFQADLKSGSTHPYYCTVSNHSQEGMEGMIVVK